VLENLYPPKRSEDEEETPVANGDRPQTQKPQTQNGAREPDRSLTEAEVDLQLAEDWQRLKRAQGAERPS
jgi:hypothetical protein